MRLNIFNVKQIFQQDGHWEKCSLVTIGTFDGVHKGHRFVLNLCKQISEENTCHWLLYTFDPHPREVLGNGNFKLITTLEEKLFLLEKFGVESVFVQKFTKEFAQKTAKEFLESELISKLNVKHLVIGYDHQFGKDREGNYNVLKDLSDKYGFSLHRVEPVYNNDVIISSTKIRYLLENGNVKQANEMLGYPFMMMANVVEGFKIGRTLGYPTANLSVDNPKKIIPKTGVYAVWVLIDNKIYNGVLNIGYRPTLNIPNHPLSVEVYILDFNQDIYGKKIIVHFLERFRDDEKFETLEDLRKQIAKDVEKAKFIFNNNNFNDLINF